MACESRLALGVSLASNSNIYSTKRSSGRPHSFVFDCKRKSFYGLSERNYESHVDERNDFERNDFA